jgi:SulP family sulfate permease
MNKYHFSQLGEAFQQALIFTLLNIIFVSMITIGLNISPKYGFIATVVGCIIGGVVEKNRPLVFAPSLILIAFLQPIIAKYGINTFIIIAVLASFITYGFGYLKLTKYFVIFPRAIFVGITMASSFFCFLLALKYVLGLKANITSEYYYLNIISLYKNLRFTNWAETLVGMLTIVSFLFFEKFELKSWSYIFSFAISVIFNYCLSCQGYKLASIDNSLTYIMSDSIISLNFDDSIPIISNIKVALLSLNNMDINNFAFYITTSLLLAIVIIIESVVTIEVYNNLTTQKNKTDKIIKNLSFINLISTLSTNFIVSLPLARNILISSVKTKIKLLNIIQALLIICLVKFGYPILSYIPVAGLAALLIITSYQISNIEKFIWFMRFGTTMDKIIIYLIIIFCIVLNMIEGLKLGLIIAAISIVYRFAFKQIEEYILPSQISGNMNLENKIKNSMTYRIQEASFFGIISDSVSNLQLEKEHPESLILDITNIQELDQGSINALETMVVKQNSYFKEVIICCNNNLFSKVKAEIKAPVRIIVSSHENF